MKLIPASDIEGVLISKANVFADHRGEFSKFTPFFQSSSQEFYIGISKNTAAGTIRGFHLQKSPNSEEKIVGCVQGGILDVIIDLRKDSRTFGNWAEIEISSSNALLLHVPHGVAHGFQTLCENTIVQYLLTSQYSPDSAITINPFYNSKINGRIKNLVVSERDRNGLDFDRAASIFEKAQNSV